METQTEPTTSTFTNGQIVEVSNLNKNWIKCKFVTMHPDGSYIINRSFLPEIETLESWKLCREFKEEEK